jgi:hypothetical protein
MGGSSSTPQYQEITCPVPKPCKTTCPETSCPAPKSCPAEKQCPEVKCPKVVCPKQNCPISSGNDQKCPQPEPCNNTCPDVKCPDPEPCTAASGSTRSGNGPSISTSAKTSIISLSNALGGNGGNDFRSQCPVGQHMTGLNVRSGSLIDSVQGRCSGGGTTDKAGGNGGGYKELKCGDPIQSVAIRSGRLVDQISVCNKKAGGNGGGQGTIRCGPGTRAVGIYGKAGGLVDKLGLVCEKV